MSTPLLRRLQQQTTTTTTNQQQQQQLTNQQQQQLTNQQQQQQTTNQQQRSKRPLPPIPPQQQQQLNNQQQQHHHHQNYIKSNKSLPQPPTSSHHHSIINHNNEYHQYYSESNQNQQFNQTNNIPSSSSIPHLHQQQPTSINTPSATNPTISHQPVVPQLIFDDDPDEQKEEEVDMENRVPTIITPDDHDDHTVTGSNHSNLGARKTKKPFIEQRQPQPNPIIPQRRVSSQSKINNRSVPQMIFTTDDDDNDNNNVGDGDGDDDNNEQQIPIINSNSMDHTSKPQFNSLTCSGCKQIIAGRIVHALSQRWHPDCFTCHHCHLALEHVAFYEQDGKAYCGVDYDELFSLKCYHCNTSINEDSYVTLDNPSLEGGPRHYHKLHLFCSECGDPFINPKSLEERSRISKNHSINLIQQDKIHVDDGQPKPFVLFKGFPYCENCDIKLHRPKCAQCKRPVVDDFIHALNKNFHSDCFVCFVCHLPFANNQFFLIDLDTLEHVNHQLLDPKKKINHQVPICLNCYS